MTTSRQLLSDQKRYAQEATLTRKVKEWLEVQWDITFYKASDRYHKGVSDIIACVRGIYVGIELKADGNVPSAHQVLFIQQVRRVGGIAGVCYTLHDVKVLVDEARKKAV